MRVMGRDSGVWRMSFSEVVYLVLSTMSVEVTILKSTVLLISGRGPTNENDRNRVWSELKDVQ